MDPQIIATEECRIRAFNRSENYLNIIANLEQGVTKLKVSFRFIKRERGGWHPFLYAMSVDVCKFFDGSFKNPLTTIIYDYLVAYTNLNHSCPYLVFRTII
ncbi:uncharacterized protein Dmoj_GI25629 [Drosophila mojavensis]|uniref:Uncharacterized protein n=1 Tax=Drosophila mojavensis TaxID=7230 RepID=A0A0Q9XAR6_DROMO|nr:uncharacterized protein Dmoj_GI25629 [Drosophila mojavensis]